MLDLLQIYPKKLAHYLVLHEYTMPKHSAVCSGLNFMVNYAYGDLFEAGKLIGQEMVSLAFDLNLYLETNIPLRISPASAYVNMPEFTAVQTESTFLANTKTACTGSDGFQMSLDASAFRAPYLIGRLSETSDIETSVFNYSLNVLIYFN